MEIREYLLPPVFSPGVLIPMETSNLACDAQEFFPVFVPQVGQHEPGQGSCCHLCSRCEAEKHTTFL